MNKNIEREKNKRFIFFKYEKTRFLLKAIVNNSNIDILIRQKASLELSRLPRNSSKVRLHKRCVLTGRGRSILSSFSLSRLMLRKLAFEGLIPGLRKSSW